MRCRTAVYSVLIVALMVPAYVTAVSNRVAHMNSPDAFDVLIVGGRIMDGSGNTSYHADIGIRNKRIIKIGRLGMATAKQKINADGQVIAPGFIDLMGQSDWLLLVDSRAASHLTQGITLEVSGEGESVAPTNSRLLREQEPFFAKYGIKPNWTMLEDFFRELEKHPPAINFATFVGAGTLRKLVIGDDNRPATPGQLKQMEDLAAAAMEQGAFGISTALMYAPGRFASTVELIALAKVVARYNGVYVTHQRSEGDGIDSSLDEIFRIAREANIPAHIFHLKTMYRQNFGKMPVVIRRIEAARREGLDITADVYPYVAASASLDALLPLWARDGGREPMLQRLRDPVQRARIKKDLKVSTTEWENEYYGAGGAAGFVITDVTNPGMKSLVGRRLSEIAQEQKKDPVDVIMDLILEDAAPPEFVSFIMEESDVRLALQQSWAAFCTDSPIRALDGPLFEGSPHPRAYGAFTRVLGHYVREEHLLTLEDAIRKATSLPAQLLGLQDRGLIREGLYADLVIFDPEKVIDRSTFERPHQYSAGISYVLVNGEIVVDHGQISSARPGMVLKGSGSIAKH